ncbi:MAG TPA: chloride channel protein [Opitutaceae bacterium]|jgi:CIC family chloride channel protein
MTSPATDSIGRKGLWASFERLKLLTPSKLWEALGLSALAIAAGLAVMLFHGLTHWIEDNTIARLEHRHTWEFVVGSLVCVMGGSLLASWVIATFAPTAGGGGVLPVKLAFWRDFGVMRKREATVKLIASALTLGSGVSMGPEGPSIQIGAATMSSLAGAAGVAKQSRRAWCAAGGAAGLAAVFNAPLAAITFILEEIIGDLNSKLLGRVVFAAVIGALIGHAVLGPQPAFQSSPLADLSWKGWTFVPVVAVVAALGGAWFQRLALMVRSRLNRLVLPARVAPYRPAIGAFFSWAPAIAVFLMTRHAGVFGIGYEDITEAIAGHLAVGTLALLCLGKIAATAAAVGASGCGGIFAPSLFIGAMGGGAVAGAASHYLHLSPGETSMLVMVGMGASLGAVIRTPLTCVLLLFEVTNQWVIVPALMLAAVVSQFVARRVNHHDMYEEILLQDGVDPHQVLPPRHFKRWREIPVSALATFQPIVIRDLSPAGLRAVLAASPHLRFPVGGPDGRINGTVARREAELAMQSGTAPRIDRPEWVGAKSTVGAARKLMLAGGADFLCVGNPDTGELSGVLTLHDLLRGESVLEEDE